MINKSSLFTLTRQRRHVPPPHTLSDGREEDVHHSIIAFLYEDKQYWHDGRHKKSWIRVKRGCEWSEKAGNNNRQIKRRRKHTDRKTQFVGKPHMCVSGDGAHKQPLAWKCGRRSSSLTSDQDPSRRRKQMRNEKHMQRNSCWGRFFLFPNLSSSPC